MSGGPAGPAALATCLCGVHTTLHGVHAAHRQTDSQTDRQQTRARFASIQVRQEREVDARRANSRHRPQVRHKTNRTITGGAQISKIGNQIQIGFKTNAADACTSGATTIKICINDFAHPFPHGECTRSARAASTSEPGPTGSCRRCSKWANGERAGAHNMSKSFIRAAKCSV